MEDDTGLIDTREKIVRRMKQLEEKEKNDPDNYHFGDAYNYSYLKNRLYLEYDRFNEPNRWIDPKTNF